MSVLGLHASSFPASGGTLSFFQELIQGQSDLGDILACLELKTGLNSHLSMMLSRDRLSWQRPVSALTSETQEEETEQLPSSGSLHSTGRKAHDSLTQGVEIRKEFLLL